MLEPGSQPERSNRQGKPFTRRSQVITALGISAVLLLQEQVASAFLLSDTLWDLLQKTSSPTRGATPSVPAFTGQIPGQYPSFAQNQFGGKPGTVTQTPFGSTFVPPKSFGADTENARAGIGLPSIPVKTILATNDTPTGPMTMWDALRKSDAQHPNQVSLSALARGSMVDPVTGLATPVQAPQHVRPKYSGPIGFFDSVGDTFRKLGKTLNTQIVVRGDKHVGFHKEAVAGSSDSYQNNNYFGQRGVGGSYSQTELTVQGKIGGIFNFDTHYTDNAYANPHENHFSLNYETKRYKLDAGDINGSITGNSLLDFNRALKGIQLSAEVLKGLRLTTLMSQTKAQTRTIVLQGANISGPYYVFAGQIVDGSEKVRVNDVPMVKGEDYTLDPQTGELRFIKPGAIISQNQTIAITFEAYGYQQNAGTITGYRADYKMFKNLKVGFTELIQKSPNQAAAAQTKTERFFGYESALSPYVLSYGVDATITYDANKKPISAIPTHPMTALVDGIPQIYGTDFQLDPQITNRVYFRAAIPRTAVVQITYYPISDNVQSGNRKIMGFDSNLSLGKTGNITAEMANSSLGLSGKSVAGAAKQIRGDMRFLKDKLNWTWNYRNINPNFTAIESPGFNSNEKGGTMGFNYQASKDLKLNLNMSKTKRPSYSYSSVGSSYGSATGLDDYNQNTAGISYTLAKNSTLTLNHNASSTLLAAGGKSAFGNDTLDLNMRLKKINVSFSLGENSNNSAYNGATTGSGTGTTAGLTGYNSSSLMGRVNMQWIASEKLNFGAVFSNSNINTSGKKTQAKDMQFTTAITAIRNMQINLGYQLQNSGGFSNTSTTTNTGTGTGTGTGSGSGSGVDPRKSTNLTRDAVNTTGNYYGGGTNGGLGNYGNYSGGFNSGVGQFSSGNFGGNTKAVTMGFTYQPIQSLNLSLNYNKSSSEGDYLYNSKRNDIALVASYNLGERLNFSTNIAQQKVNYIGSSGGSSTKLVGVTMNATPFKKLITRVNLSRTQSSSSQATTTGSGAGTGTGVGTFFGGDSNIQSLGFRIEYPLFKNNNLFFQSDSSSGTGYAATDVKNMNVGIDFNFSNSMTFTFGWRSQNHTSKDTNFGGSNYNYRVSSLDADLHLHFR